MSSLALDAVRVKIDDPSKCCHQRAASILIDIRHWLLDAAVELAIPLRILGAPNVGEILNRKTHGLSTSDLAMHLDELIERSEIEIFTYCNGQQVRARPCNDEIVRLLSEDRWEKSVPWFYRLTPLGGAEWEGWAKPQWSRYNATCSWDNFNEIGAATESVAEELLELEEHVLRECAIIQESIRRRVFRNWQATYWKTLPEGHLIACRTKPLTEGNRAVTPDDRWARWVELGQFYLRPADCGF
jgi:hypothetical protein